VRPALAARCTRLPLAEAILLEALDPFRDVRLLDDGGAQVRDVLHQMRDEDGSRYLFVCNTDRHKGCERLELRVRGEWAPVLCDTLQGDMTPMAATCADGWTRIACRLEAHGQDRIFHG